MQPMAVFYVWYEEANGWISVNDTQTLGREAHIDSHGARCREMNHFKPSTT